MLQNDFRETISYKNIQELLPEYFTPVDLQKIESVLSKLNKHKSSYASLDDLLKKERFSYEEVSSIALWKASRHYSQSPAEIKGTEERIFLAILNRFTQHFLDLARKR